MRLDWWATSAFKSEAVMDEAKAFTQGDSKVFLVENQAELDLAEALQYIYGAGVLIKIVSRPNFNDIQTFLPDHLVVYTSWDPLDPNRI